jgi:hypothetical protein
MPNVFHGVVKSPDGPGSIVSDGSMLQDIGEGTGDLGIGRQLVTTEQLVGSESLAIGNDPHKLLTSSGGPLTARRFQ